MFETRNQNGKMEEVLRRLEALERKNDCNGESTHSQERGRTRLLKRGCVYCNTTGQRPGPLGIATPLPCNVCKGRGYNLIPEDWSECAECGGTGKVTYVFGIARMDKRCTACHGEGWAEARY
jgi:DnaJ-class molecular chaperone